MTILNSPMVLAKFIVNLHTTTIIKNINLFINYLIREKTFDPLMTLEAGERVFMVALLSIKDEMNIEEVIRIFKDLPL